MNKPLINPIFHILFITLLLPACQPTPVEPTTHELIPIRHSTLPSPSRLSDILEFDHLIPLETTEAALFDHTHQLEFHGDRIFILSFMNERGVLVFDQKGKFIRSIGHQGKGPGEYTDLDNFSVLENPERIFLTDRATKKTIEFDWNGQFIREIKTPVRPADLRFTDPNHYFLAYPQEYYLRHVDLSTNTIKSYLPHTNGWDAYGKTIYTQGDHSFLFSPQYHDSVYTFSGDSILLRYAFDMGPHLWTGEMQNAEFQKTWRMTYPPGKLEPAGPFFDLGRYFSFCMFYEDDNQEYTIGAFLWDSEANRLIALDEHSDDLLFASSYALQAVSEKGEWVVPLSADELVAARDQIAGNPHLKNNQKLLQQIDQLDPEDNMVLAFFKIIQ